MEPRPHENAPPNVSNGIYGSNEVRNSFGPMIEAVAAELERESKQLQQNGASAQNGQATFNPHSEIDISGTFQSANNTMGEDNNSISEDAIIDVSQDQSLVDDSLEIQGNRNKVNANDEQPYFGPRSKDFTRTTGIAWWMMAMNLFILIMVFALPIACNRKGRTPAEVCGLEPFSWLLYSHTVYWVCHLIGDQWLKFEHRMHRMTGFVEFYIKTKNLRRTPFYIISFGNAVLLVAAVALEDYCDNNASDHSCEYKETKIEVLRGLITVQVLTISYMWTKYLMTVYKFQKKNIAPDLWRREFRDRVFNFAPRTMSSRVPSPDEAVEGVPGPSNAGASNQTVDEDAHLYAQQVNLTPRNFGRPPTRDEVKDEIIVKQAELIRLLAPDLGVVGRRFGVENDPDRTVQRHVS